jgi:hypothetical protein
MLEMIFFLAQNNLKKKTNQANKLREKNLVGKEIE